MNGFKEATAKVGEFRIMTQNFVDGDLTYSDLNEGPWESEQDAIDFAENEVGIPWIVVLTVAVSVS